MTVTRILQDGTRLFVPAEISDWTGSCNVRLGERAALCAAGLSSKDEFIEMQEKGQLRLQRVHLRLKRSIVGDNKQVSLVAVCACLAPFSTPIPFVGPLLETKILPAKLDQLRNIPYGGLAVEVQGELVQVRSAVVLLRCSGSLEMTRKTGTIELCYKGAQDASVDTTGATVDISYVVGEGQEAEVQWQKGDVLLAHVISVEFDEDSSLTEVCCSDMQLASDQQATVSAFAAELAAVQLTVAEARTHGSKKRKFSGASDLDEYFSPDKRRVCMGLQSPPSKDSRSEG